MKLSVDNILRIVFAASVWIILCITLHCLKGIYLIRFAFANILRIALFRLLCFNFDLLAPLGGFSNQLRTNFDELLTLKPWRLAFNNAANFRFFLC